MKEKFNLLTDTCVPLPFENIDTDQIIPARFLKSTSKEGMGENLFYDWRYDKSGNLISDFALNNPTYHGKILLAGKNFGSGSSREHAAWAIADYGFRAIISSYFADIHKNNELNNFVLPVVVSEAFLQTLFQAVATNPETQIEINLPAQTVTDKSSGQWEHFDIDCYKKQCLMEGLDDIDFLLSNKDKIEQWEQKREKSRYMELLDTTLRDGEQTGGVSFVPHEKLMITKLLLEALKVDRVEIGSARVSSGEKEAVKLICEWAKRHNVIQKIEVLGFIDGHTSPDWIKSCGGSVVNLLAKGSLKHCTGQLGKSTEQHIADIKETVTYATQIGLTVNLYLEDWSKGMEESPEYVYQMMDSLQHLDIKRFMLSDTLGTLNPLTVEEYITQMVTRYPQLHFDFHAHNDYDLAVSNVFTAARCGVKGIHATVNGLGERAGNPPIASVQAVLKDQLNFVTGIDESKLNDISHVVESYSGIHVSVNQPVVGENVFTQVSGVHADGDHKNDLYYNALLPERFGRKRDYALGKTSGKANIRKNLERLGLELDEQTMKKVTERVTELGDKKELVTLEDLPYIITDVLKHNTENDKVKLISYFVNLTGGLKPIATIKIEINGICYEESSSGDGQYDAFVRALRKVYKTTLGRKFPMLTNYAVSIPPGGRTDAFVQTIISWDFDNRILRTRGFDADQTEAAIKATLKMLNIIEDSYEKNS